MKLKENYFLALVFLVGTLSYSQISVSTVAEFESALNAANAGDVITVANGTYVNADLNIDVTGGSTTPVIIQAEDAGSVFLEGNSKIEISGSYITFKGFVFQNPDYNLITEGVTPGDADNDGGDIDSIIRLNDCDYCVVENIKIDSYNASADPNDVYSVYSVFKWLLLDGQYNEVRYCSFTGKNGIGSIINDNRNTAEEDFLKIHHNYFADRVPADGLVNTHNDQDAIRLGNSGTSLFDSSSEVYDNYFYNFFGEVEMISNKSGNNKYYNNTFRNYAGSLTLRHGNGCEVYGNFFFAEGNNFTAGVRVIGEDHKIYNNYIQDINSRRDNGNGTTSGSNATGAINVSNGVIDSPLNRYFQVKNTSIVNNTIVNCDLGVRIGTAFDTTEQTLAPENLQIANNIIMNATNNAFQITSTPSGVESINQGNLNYNGSWDLTEGINGNQTVNTPLLEAGADYYEITSTSEAVGAALGTYDYISIDAFDAARDALVDVGAEEFGVAKVRMPFTAADVGVSVGFGALEVSDPILTVNPSATEINKEATTLVFNINSNVDWTVSENYDWLTLNTTSGNGIELLTVTIDENDTSAEREAIIEINEMAGGDDLSTTITITQTTDFTPVEIPVEEVTAVGTQTDDAGAIVNGPENLIDGNTGTRWSAQSTDGSAYATFDLGCVHTLTEVSIYFHKSTVRTTEFILATSVDGIDFVDNTPAEISSTLLDVEAYENFAMNETQVQFVRIYGYGNTQDGVKGVWNSIEEVKFYGDMSCEDNGTLSLVDAFDNTSDNEFAIYPIPAINGELTIQSENLSINGIEVYNIAGQKVLMDHAAGATTKSLDVLKLSSGVYFLVLEGLGTAKFLVK